MQIIMNQLSTDVNQFVELGIVLQSNQIQNIIQIGLIANLIKAYQN